MGLAGMRCHALVLLVGAAGAQQPGAGTVTDPACNTPCMMPACAAPPQGCEYAPTEKDVCGCTKGCGELRCTPTCEPLACRMDCPNGLAKDAKGCDKCECASTCVMCTQAVPQCDAGCKSCTVTPGSCDRCAAAVCEDCVGCSTMRCGAGTTCQETVVQCVTSPCCPVAECKPAATPAPKPQCEPVQCKMLCPNGWAKDANNCDKCECAGPDCTAPCVMPDCAAPPAGCDYGPTEKDACGCTKSCGELRCTPACEPLACRMDCPNGLAKDAKGCDKCECADAPCPEVLCMKPCPAGSAGFKRDAKGCQTCDCEEPPCPPCMMPACAAPPQGCEYGRTEKDACGCPIGCGTVKCSTPVPAPPAPRPFWVKLNRGSLDQPDWHPWCGPICKALWPIFFRKWCSQVPKPDYAACP